MAENILEKLFKITEWGIDEVSKMAENDIN